MTVPKTKQGTGIGDADLKRLARTALDTAAGEAYRRLCGYERYEEAAQVAKDCRAEEEMKAAAKKAYGMLITEEPPDKHAARVARHFRLSKAEKKEGIVWVYETEIAKKHYRNAARIAKKFKLEKWREMEAAEKAYENYFTHGSYRGAAMIARDFKLGEEKKRIAALKEYEQALLNRNYDYATDLAIIFKLGKDVIKDSQKLAKMEGVMKKEDYKERTGE